jgi:monofunctional biosynthetic peptidoglycan transglycosylase
MIKDLKSNWLILYQQLKNEDCRKSIEQVIKKLTGMSKKEKRLFIRFLFHRSALILAGLVTFSIFQVSIIKFLNPPATPLMVYRWLCGGKVDFRWRSLSEISPFLQRAVIAAEDQRFFSHHGFDWKQIERALQEYQKEGRVRGASTITMQVARNIFLWQGYSWLRKGLEAYYTALIELLWPKSRIMEVYLNVVELGPEIFGAEAAACRYFGFSAASLTKPQAALLAAILPNPHRWSPKQPSDYIRKRQSTILREMKKFKTTLNPSPE